MGIPKFVQVGFGTFGRIRRRARMVNELGEDEEVVYALAIR
jgi:hypothetical protein